MAVLGLCFVFVAFNMVFVILFAACTTIAVAQAVQVIWVSVSTSTPGSISVAAIFAGGLCIWISGKISRHLLFDYMVIATPIIFGVLALAGEITIPSYTTIWALLICGQSSFSH